MLDERDLLLRCSRQWQGDGRKHPEVRYTNGQRAARSRSCCNRAAVVLPWRQWAWLGSGVGHGAELRRNYCGHAQRKAMPRRRPHGQFYAVRVGQCCRCCSSLLDPWPGRAQPLQFIRIDDDVLVLGVGSDATQARLRAAALDAEMGQPLAELKNSDALSASADPFAPMKLRPSVWQPTSRPSLIRLSNFWLRTKAFRYAASGEPLGSRFVGFPAPGKWRTI